MYNLTETEKEVLELMTKGFTNKEIGKKLYVSVHTAKSHVSAIIRKMNTKSRASAAYLAGKFNLV